MQTSDLLGLIIRVTLAFHLLDAFQASSTVWFMCTRLFSVLFAYVSCCVTLVRLFWFLYLCWCYAPWCYCIRFSFYCVMGEETSHFCYQDAQDVSSIDLLFAAHHAKVCLCNLSQHLNSSWSVMNYFSGLHPERAVGCVEAFTPHWFIYPRLFKQTATIRIALCFLSHQHRRGGLLYFCACIGVQISLERKKISSCGRPHCSTMLKNSADVDGTLCEASLSGLVWHRRFSSPAPRTGDCRGFGEAISFIKSPTFSSHSQSSPISNPFSSKMVLRTQRKLWGR